MGGPRSWERHCVVGGRGGSEQSTHQTRWRLLRVLEFCDRCDTELKLVMQPITACAGRCGHAVASVGAVRALSRDSYRRCALLVYDIV